MKTIEPVGNTKLEELCTVFDQGGIEKLLYVIKDFQIAFKALKLEINNYDTVKKYFKKVLGHGAAGKFQKLIQQQLYVNTVVKDRVNVPAHLHHRVTEYAFKKLLKGYIKLYCTSTDPKGDVITYLKLEKAKKPMDKSVSDHQDEMIKIMRYSTYLEGVRDNVSEDETTTILFNSFPVMWQINYKRSQPAFQQTSIEDVMIFMSQEKEFSDASKKHSNFWQQRGGDSGYG